MTVPDADARGPAPANPGVIATADDPGAPATRCATRGTAGSRGSRARASW